MQFSEKQKRTVTENCPRITKYEIEVPIIDVILIYKI